MFVQTKTDLEKLRNLINTRNVSLQEISYTRNGYRVLFKELKPYEKEVMGESFNEFAARAFPRIVNKNPASFSEFRAYLTEILIPDLRDSGMNSTADDFETASYYMTRGRDKKYPAWRNFIMKTLVPDLKESGQVMTAKDFVTAVKYIDAGRSVVKNPVAPSGYHYMPDGRLMADSEHSVSMNPKDQGDYNSPEVSIVYKAKYSELGWQGSGGSVEKFANFLGGRGTGGGTDMRTGLRDKSFKFKTIAGAVKFASKMKPYALRISDERYNHDTMKREKLPVGKPR